MLPNHQKKVLAAIKRLNGLSKKVATMTAENANCPAVLTQILAMKGHLDYMQSEVLQSHLKTCAPKNLTSKNADGFIAELMKSIGLTKR